MGWMSYPYSSLAPGACMGEGQPTLGKGGGAQKRQDPTVSRGQGGSRGASVSCLSRLQCLQMGQQHQMWR